MWSKVLSGVGMIDHHIKGTDLEGVALGSNLTWGYQNLGVAGEVAWSLASGDPDDPFASLTDYEERTCETRAGYPVDSPLPGQYIDLAVR